jgi:hypothetical protein
MDDLTAVHVKKRMRPRHERTMQEEIESEFRLTDFYINSKRQTTIQDC